VRYTLARPTVEDLDAFGLGDATKKTIREGAPKGARSEAIYAAISKMRVSAWRSTIRRGRIFPHV
jgi:hypothetical protein